MHSIRLNWWQVSQTLSATSLKTEQQVLQQMAAKLLLSGPIVAIEVLDGIEAVAQAMENSREQQAVQQLVIELRAHCQAAAKGQIQLTEYIIAAEKHQGHTARLEAFAQVLQPCVWPAHL